MGKRQYANMAALASQFKYFAVFEKSLSNINEKIYFGLCNNDDGNNDVDNIGNQSSNEY